MVRESGRRSFRLVAALALVLVLAAALLWWQARQLPALLEQLTGPIGGSFELVDHNGRTVSQSDWPGRFLLVYFGYTHCPDVCPTELGRMALALDRLGPLAERVQPLLITVDPERDRPALLADYVALFHPRLVGLSGTPAQVAAAAARFRVTYAKVPGPSGMPADSYFMDHTSFVYLIGPDRRLVVAFPPGTEADRMAQRIGAVLAALPSQPVPSQPGAPQP